MELTEKKEFIELVYTGKANGSVFDSNIPEDLKTLNPEAKPKKTILAIGEGMVVTGLDNALEGKEIGKEYSIKISSKDAFGERKRELVKTIPLKIFREQNVTPYPGASLLLDNNLVKIITVSGARVITDFNHPLASKEVEYKFTIIRKVIDEKEKVESLFDHFLRITPEMEINPEKIVIKGSKNLEHFFSVYKKRFQDILGKTLEFKEEKKEGEKTSQGSL